MIALRIDVDPSQMAVLERETRLFPGDMKRALAYTAGITARTIGLAVRNQGDKTIGRLADLSEFRKELWPIKPFGGALADGYMFKALKINNYGYYAGSAGSVRKSGKARATGGIDKIFEKFQDGGSGSFDTAQRHHWHKILGAGKKGSVEVPKTFTTPPRHIVAPMAPHEEKEFYNRVMAAFESIQARLMKDLPLKVKGGRGGSSGSHSKGSMMNYFRAKGRI